MSKQVLIVLAQGSEELEAVTVSDLLVRAGIKVVIAGLDSHLIQCSRGLTIQADATFAEAKDEDFAAIVLPGGLPGADHLMNCSALAQRLRQQEQEQKLVAAICAAPRVIVQNELFLGADITCFPGALDNFNHQSYQLSSDAVVKYGNLITSRGPGTAMDFALTIIEAVENTQIREMVEKGLVR